MMGKPLVCLIIVVLLFPMCKKQTDKEESADFSVLNGNNYVLKTDRVSQAPDVQAPRDSLRESDYTEVTEGNIYDVVFSENGQIVTVNPGSVSGQKIKDGLESKYYDIVHGFMAGGRFIVWKNDGGFEAEFTKYGSGIPIIKSERGKLEIKPE